MPRSSLTKTIVLLLKFGISVGILGYLIYYAMENQAFDQLRDRPKNWMLLGLALMITLTSVVLTFVRWYVLVRTLDLPFSLKDAMRLGFLGLFCNYLSLGSVGGDLFKAIFLAREQPGNRTKAIASVVVDRIVGLYSLFLLASCAALLMDVGSASDVREVRLVSNAAMLCSVLGGLGIAFLMIPGVTGGKITGALGELPWMGKILVQLVEAIRAYRAKIHVVLFTILMSMVSHSLFAVAFFLTASGLRVTAPTLAEHFLIVPFTNLAGAIPLPLGALGAIEGSADLLYHYLSRSADVPRGNGLVVALGYRLMMIAVTMIGLFYYFASRREVLEVMHEVEEEE